MRRDLHRMRRIAFRLRHLLSTRHYLSPVLAALAVAFVLLVLSRSLSWQSHRALLQLSPDDRAVAAVIFASPPLSDEALLDFHLCPWSQQRQQTLSALEPWPHVLFSAVDSWLFVYETELLLTDGQPVVLRALLAILPAELLICKKNAKLGKCLDREWELLRSARIDCLWDGSEQGVAVTAASTHRRLLFNDVMYFVQCEAPRGLSGSEDGVVTVTIRWQLNEAEAMLPLSLCHSPLPAVRLLLMTPALMPPLPASILCQWLDYYLYLGVDVVLVSDRFGYYAQAVAPYVAAGVVRYQPFPLSQRITGVERVSELSFDQVYLVQSALMRHRNSAQYMAHLDCDEWLQLLHPSFSHQGGLHDFLNTAFDKDDTAAIQLGSQYFTQHPLNPCEGERVPVNDPAEFVPVSAGQQLSARYTDSRLRFVNELVPWQFQHRELQAQWEERKKWLLRPLLVDIATHHQPLPYAGAVLLDARNGTAVPYCPHEAALLQHFPHPGLAARVNHYIHMTAAHVIWTAVTPGIQAVRDLSLLPTLSRLLLWLQDRSWAAKQPITAFSDSVCIANQLRPLSPPRATGLHLNITRRMNELQPQGWTAAICNLSGDVCLSPFAGGLSLSPVRSVPPADPRAGLPPALQSIPLRFLAPPSTTVLPLLTVRPAQSGQYHIGSQFGWLEASVTGGEGTLTWRRARGQKEGDAASDASFFRFHFMQTSQGQWEAGGLRIQHVQTGRCLTIGNGSVLLTECSSELQQLWPPFILTPNADCPVATLELLTS